MAEPAGKDHDVNVSDLSYEEARDELIAIVRALEQGGAPLEESLALWQRGEELAKICQAKLEGAQEQLARAQGADES
ncbi:MAG: exodeoxyribonuclease VII small subunit [Nocardioidaceae bacterium]|nr:MAG: exodeoxyribonuclease VII small subunit [Nocardioidaceae bacterium]